MLEDTKVDRFFMRLYAPRDGMFSFNVNPADEIRLKAIDGQLWIVPRIMGEDTLL